MLESPNKLPSYAFPVPYFTYYDRLEASFGLTPLNIYLMQVRYVPSYKNLIEIFIYLVDIASVRVVSI